MSKWMKKEEKLGHVGGKVLIYGREGTGKSQGAGSFPRINLIDAEDGNTFYLAENDNILNILPTTSAAEVQDAINELNDPEMLKEFDTIVVDSGTKLYENMQAAAYEIAEQRAKKQKMQGKAIDLDDLNLAQRDWGHIKRWNQQLQTSYILMASQGKWAVVTSHEKDETKEMGDRRVVIGNMPDLAKKAGHDFDIIIRTSTKKDPASGEIKYYAEIKKDRTGVTKVGQELDVTGTELFSIWKDKWESTRNLGVKKVDLSKDVEKSMVKMELEDEQLETLTANFKAKMESCKEDQEKIKAIQAILKELNIANPLRCTDLGLMKQLMDKVDKI